MNKKLSIIVPVYNEEENVKKTYDSVTSVMEDIKSKYDYELLFTDNPNPDKAVATISSWFRQQRMRLGKKNPKWLERYDDGKGEYKYQIYSLRAKFITDSLKADPSGNAGHSFAGHIKYMQVYERFTIEESCKMYDKCEEGFKGNVAKVEEEVSELRQENMKLREEIHIEREQNKIDIQKILDNAEKNRLNDLAEIEIKIAESEISKSKKKSK